MDLMAAPATANASFLNSKLGPAPVWVWGAGGLAAAYAVSKYRPAKAAAAAAAAGPTAKSPSDQSTGTTSAQVPDFIIQNYMQNPGITPPAAPATTPAPPVAPPAQHRHRPPTPPAPTPAPTPAPAPAPAPAPTPAPIAAGPAQPPPGNPSWLPPAFVASLDPNPVFDIIGAPAAPRPAAASPIHYTVKAGDSLASIGARYGKSWQDLFNYNTTPGVRSAADIQTIKSRGPNLVYSGETILIPG